MILNNISEETFYGRVYDNIIVDKFIKLLEASLSGQISADQATDMIQQAFKMQFTDFAKREKIQKQKDTVKFNTDYCTFLFSKIVHSGEQFDNILTPKTERQYRLLKSYLHPLLETITWTNPNNLGYNNTIVNWVFFPEEFEKSIPGAWVLENIYSFKTTLKFQNKQQLADGVFKKYLLNPWGILFIKHKDKLAVDVKRIIDSMASRKIIKNEMIVLGQLLINILAGNDFARKLASMLLMKKFNDISDQLIEDAGIANIMKDKNINSVNQLTFEQINTISDIIIDSLSTGVSERDLGQNSRKVYMNLGFGIKGLISFLFASPLLGNAITSAGKIYGIKTAQNITAQYMEHKNLIPDIA